MKIKFKAYLLLQSICLCLATHVPPISHEEYCTFLSKTLEAIESPRIRLVNTCIRVHEISSPTMDDYDRTLNKKGFIYRPYGKFDSEKVKYKLNSLFQLKKKVLYDWIALQRDNIEFLKIIVKFTPYITGNSSEKHLKNNPNQSIIRAYVFIINGIRKKLCFDRITQMIQKEIDEIEKYEKDYKRNKYIYHNELAKGYIIAIIESTQALLLGYLETSIITKTLYDIIVYITIFLNKMPTSNPSTSIIENPEYCKGASCIICNLYSKQLEGITKADVACCDMHLAGIHTFRIQKYWLFTEQFTHILYLPDTTVSLEEDPTLCQKDSADNLSTRKENIENLSKFKFVPLPTPTYKLRTLRDAFQLVNI